MRSSLRLAASFASMLVAVAILVAARPALAVTGPEAVARAQLWVDAQLPYCQCPNHAWDKMGQCNRVDNADWDPYRTDCSGLVSWAWGLPPPGDVTWTLWNDATVIDATDLKPGDALNSSDHVMLFAGWTSFPDVANLIDEHNWGTVARRMDFNVSINGSTVTRSDWPSNPFTAIRYNGIQNVCAPHCEGSVMIGADCGQGDCGAFGASCADDAIGLRCVSVFCPAQGPAKVCLPNSNVLGTCADGAISTGDCGAYGAICSSFGGDAHCVAPYAATLLGSGSNAMTADDGALVVCAGAPVDTWLELQNDGYAAWSDSSDPDPQHLGTAVRLGVTPGSASDIDPITGTARISITTTQNADAHFDGSDCKDHGGCRSTVFHVQGNAPQKAGMYTSNWQLVDELRTWFGPMTTQTYRVVDCESAPMTTSSSSGAVTSGSTGSGLGAHGSGQGGAGPDESTNGDDGAMTGSCAVAAPGAGEGGLRGLALAVLAAFTIARSKKRSAQRTRGAALLAATTLALGVAGCGAEAPVEPSDEPVAVAQESLKVCPGGATVPGIDISSWQGQIDWDAVGTAGLAFAITRIGDGYGSDQYFQTNWDQIKAHGMIRGAYQFYEPNDDAATLANIVVAAVGHLGPGDLPVTLDVEWTNGTPTAGPIQTWIDIVTQGTGKRPMIYTAVGYWNQYFNGEFGNIDLWVANWGVSCPSVPNSWSNWIFWQPGGGSTPGIAGNVDQDVFNGSLQDLQILADADTSSNCAASQAGACAHFGCHCVNDACDGGFCPGGGCTADQIAACGNYGCNCVDGQCGGGFCPGAGCTAKEEIDCQNQGLGCVDHVCSDGCTAKEQIDCGNQNQDCAKHLCVAKNASSSAASSSSSTSGASTTTSGASTSASSGEMTSSGGQGGGQMGQGGYGGSMVGQPPGSVTSTTTGGHIVNSGVGGGDGVGDGELTGSCSTSSTPTSGAPSFGLLLALAAVLRGRRKVTCTT